MVIKENSEGFDFNEFKKKCRTIRQMVSELTSNLNDSINQDLYDKENGVLGEPNIGRGTAEKVCDELEAISNRCDNLVKFLIAEYNL